MSSRKMYFLLHQHGRAGTQPQGLYCISIYDLSSISLHSEPPPEIVIPCSSEVEEIRPDSQDERIVYSTTDLKLFGMNIIKNVKMHTRQQLLFAESSLNECNNPLHFY